MERFEAEHGWGFSYLVALTEGSSRGLPTGSDAEAWARETGVQTPVLADIFQSLEGATPYQGPIPHRCALSPDMVMLACYQGEPHGEDPAIQAIIEHRAAHPR